MSTMIVKKRFVTLIEMMIVMFLISMLIGVLAYNYRGTLDEGKAFKTKIGIQKLETILNLAAAENPAILENIDSRWQDVVKNSPLVQNSSALIQDGWGIPYQVTVEEGRGIVVHSARYDEYSKAHPESMFGEDRKE